MTWRTWFRTTHLPRSFSVSKAPGNLNAAALHTRLAASLNFVRTRRIGGSYSPTEVRARLREDGSGSDPRTAAVHAAAAAIGAWMYLLPAEASREHHLGLAAARLPSVVFWYRHGLSAEEIGRRLTPFGCGCYGDRAIDAACALIAAHLNSAAHRGLFGR
jgi:hypothetical protein